MNATDFNKISKEITNPLQLDKVYNDILVPSIMRVAERKGQELEIRDNMHQHQVGVKLKELGFKCTLQRLIETEMKPFLEDKGFKIAIYSPNYLVGIRW